MKGTEKPVDVILEVVVRIHFCRVHATLHAVLSVCCSFCWSICPLILMAKYEIHGDRKRGPYGECNS